MGFHEPTFDARLAKVLLIDEEFERRRASVNKLIDPRASNRSHPSFPPHRTRQDCFDLVALDPGTLQEELVRDPDTLCRYVTRGSR